jgi:hypothetical protein
LPNRPAPLGAYRLIAALGGGWYFPGRERLSLLAKSWNLLVVLAIMGLRTADPQRVTFGRFASIVFDPTGNLVPHSERKAARGGSHDRLDRCNLIFRCVHIDVGLPARDSRTSASMP